MYVRSGKLLRFFALYEIASLDALKSVIYDTFLCTINGGMI